MAIGAAEYHYRLKFLGYDRFAGISTKIWRREIEHDRQVHFGEAGFDRITKSDIDHDPNAGPIHRRIRLYAEPAIFEILTNEINLHTLNIEHDSIVERDTADFPERFHHLIRIVIPKSEEVEILRRAKRIIEPFCQKHCALEDEPRTMFSLA